MESLKFDNYLKQTWIELYESPNGGTLFRSGFKYLHMRGLEKNGYVGFFNTAYSENKRETQIDFGDVEPVKGSDKDQEGEKVLIKDFDETKFNYNQVEPEEILFYVDLENETIITKEAYEKKKEDEMLEEQNLEDEISSSESHPILANISPVCPNHFILPLFVQEQLPQVVSSDIISLALQIFKLSEASDLKIGFNSIGACAHVNHLHFDLLYASELFKDAKLPIENAKRKSYIKSSLQDPSEEVNMCDVGVIIEELENYPVSGFIISCADPKADSGDVFNSVSFAAGAIINILIELDIPHNMLISNRGHTIYIIPRKFERDVSDFTMHASWLEISGLAISRSKDAFQSMTAETYENALRTDANLEKQEYDKIKTQVSKCFSKYK